MNRFLQLAEQEGGDSEHHNELLNWASRIKTRYDVGADEAASFAKRAVDEKSLAFVEGELQNRKRAESAGEFDATGSKGDKDLQSRTPAGRPGRIRSVAQKLGSGMSAAGPWPLKDGNWVFTSTGQGDANASKIGRCRLSSFGVMFIHTAGPQKRTIMLADDLDVPAEAKEAVWTLNTGWSRRQGLGHDGNFGTYLKIDNPKEFFAGFRDEKAVSLKVDRGKRERRVSVGHLSKVAERFTSCIDKVAAEAIAAPANRDTSAKKRELVLNRDARGHFSTTALINERPVDMLVDTGASLVTINETTAGRIGVRVTASDYRYETNTANGKARFAKAVADEIRIGTIVYTDVPIAVMKDTALSTNALLGMSFLNRLTRFEFGSGKLKIVQ